MKRWRLFVLAMACFLCGVYRSEAGDVASATASADEWPLHGRSSANDMYSPLMQIDTSSVQHLGVAWYADFNARSLRGVEGTPIVVDGVIYATGPWSKVLALDAKTGQKRWEYDPQVDGAAARETCCDVTNRGVVYADGLIYLGALDGRLIALDAKSGKLAWSVWTFPKGSSKSITGAPLIARDKVLIGFGGAEYGGRGYVSAYDLHTGKLAWRFYTVPGDPSTERGNRAMSIASPTWKGHWWQHGMGGGTVWDSMVYDPDLDLVYIGVGNGGPWNREWRSAGQGDNLYLSSIVALHPEDGSYAWHFQTSPGDEWDYTATQPLVLADLDIVGKRRKVIMQAPKNGFFYVLDRTNGAFISGKNFVPVDWATGLDSITGRPSVNPKAHYSTTGQPFLGLPSPAGGHNWQPMSYSHQTGYVYFPTVEMPYGYVAEKASDFRFSQKGWNTGQDPTRTPMPEDPAVQAKILSAVHGQLVAWDPVKQVKAWSVPLPTVWNGGTLSTAGGLVFEGNGAGYLVAYRADNGQSIWSMYMGSGIVAAPISYQIDGVQYIAIGVGYGGILPLNLGVTMAHAQGPLVNRLVVLKIGATSPMPLPKQEPPSLSVVKPFGTPAQVTHGRDLYHTYCWMCHGDTVVTGGGVPDLRHVAAVTDPTQFSAFVRKGVASSLGMPNFGKELSEADVEAIRSYIAKRVEDGRRGLSENGK